MNKVTLTLLPIILITFSGSCFADDVEGFRGVKWADSISKHKKNMRLVEGADSDTKYYLRKNDKNSIGSVQLRNIAYGFYKGKFSSAILITQKNPRAARQLIKIFKKKFGVPRKPNRYMDKYFWSKGSASITLACSSMAETCNAVFQSVVMRVIQKADAETAAEKAQGDF